MTMGMRARGLSAMVAAAVLMAACGSGGHHAKGGLLPGQLGVGTSGGVSGGSATTTGGGGGVLASPGGAAHAGGALPGGGSSASSGTGGGAPAGATVPGVVPGVSGTGGASGSRGTIKIGVPYPNDEGAIYQAVGVKSASSNPQQFQAMVNSIVNYLNAHGGIAGYHVVPVFDGYAISQGDFTTQMQAMCTFFTEDHPVFAVLFLNGNSYDPLPACLAQHHTPLVINTNSYYYDDAQLAQFGPYYYRPFMASIAEVGSQVDGLIRFGFLSASHKIGVLRWDDPQGGWAESNLVAPHLAAHGLKVASEFAYTPINSLAEVSQAANQSNNAVLRFRSAGVDRIITVASNAAFPFLFATAAESQGYRPGYGMSSMDIPGFQPGNAPSGQLPGMVAVGWNRGFDLDFNAPTPGASSIPEWQQCGAIESQGGITNGDRSACDVFFFVQRAVAGASSLSAAVLRAGVDHLGSASQAGATVNLLFRPGRDDGISSARWVVYDGGCNCMKYASTPFPVS